MILLFAGLAHAVVQAEHIGEPTPEGFVWTTTAKMGPAERCAAVTVETSLGSEVCADRDGGWITVSTTQPFPAEVLQPPLLAGPVQRVRVRRAAFYTTALEKTVGARYSPGVSPAVRHAVDRRLDGFGRIPPAAMYLDPAVVPASGLPGTLVEPVARPYVLVGAASIFGAVLVCFVFAYSYLDKVVTTRARQDR